ncbi:MAG: peptidase M4 family protein [Gammaproteobacteria bacterium]|nr:peptidase M4 family protein [Gammaproteobacteria bacterium]
MHSIQCILPPHMLETISIRGDRKVKAMVSSLIKNAEKYRFARAEASPPTAYQGVPPLDEAQQPTVYREVYDGQKKARLPGKLVRKEGDPPVCDDESVNVAYDGAGDVYDLYLDEYRRDSMDGRGMKLISTVHHRNKYNNAFWDGEQMAYGDGVVFSTMTELSVIGHELSHGVVQFSGGLIYRDQAGALNESFADVFGALTLQRKHQQSASEATWLIGGGIFGPDVNGESLRSMKTPGEAYNDDLLGKDPQPYHMDLYLNTSADNGGVHINSGIPNHAFYLLSQYLGGNAWEKAGHIWYDTLQAINNPNATFNEWADKTVEMARNRFGSGSREAIYTRRAWLLVGITV